MRYQFRVWNVMSKKMMGWGEIFNLPAWEIFPGTPEQRPFNVMQYTGLKDKNGKEIYEGDILEFSGNVVALGIVKYNENFATFQACNGNSGWLFGNESGTNIEILGNIYENPELVKN
ncbi:YopX family protein [Bacillus thuringiensis]|uniref:YopX family protein n=1 Tax=Bacillus thuringiensis TaxID=1428 RepID=UPI0011A7E4FE|nr:YopX family protein [Bacillus thuringiensis]